jgi:hypothetical protein
MGYGQGGNVMSEKDILRLIPTMESIKLVGRVSKNKSPVKSAVDAIFGTSMIRAESNIIESY